jgi:hypothetical protein
MILKVLRAAIGLILSAVVVIPSAFLAGGILLNVSPDDPSLTPTQQGLALLVLIGVAVVLLCGIWAVALRGGAARKRAG